VKEELRLASQRRVTRAFALKDRMLLLLNDENDVARDGVRLEDQASQTAR
jgi:hypothetical protein